jgi:hypothetical protein
MATVKFYKSASDDGGAIGNEITSGVVNEAIPGILTQDRLVGTEILRKQWVECDEDVTFVLGLRDRAFYGAQLFTSAGLNDTISDLTGTEDKFAAAKVLSHNGDTLTLDLCPYGDEVFRAGDRIIAGGTVVSISTVTYNVDDVTVVLDQSIDNDLTGDMITSAVSIQLTANNAKPFWVREDLPENAPYYADYNSIHLRWVI